MGNRLLLADDSITIQKVVAIIFANEEFELTVVDNGNAALDKAKEIQPDLMLVDALMPGRNGYEVCAEIRRDPKLNAVPLLLLIGAFEPLDEEKARSCGADATITKPFESQQLIDKVKELLALGKTRVAAPVPQPAPAAAPEPAFSNAEDVWGDLSGLDTMAEPAPQPTPAFQAPPAAPAAPAPQPTPQPAAASFAAPAAPAAPAAQEEIMEATLEDDLWGAFEMEAPGAPDAAETFGVVEGDVEYEAEEFFTFEEEGDDVEETGPPLELVEEPYEPAAEDVFGFQEEAVTAEPVVAAETVIEPMPLPEYEPFSLEEENVTPVEPEPAPSFFEQQAPAASFFEAAALEPVAPPVFEAPQVQQPAFAPQAPVAAPVSAAPLAPAQPVVTGITEADLEAAIARISREVIERIVWEVVPDLAEVLIKEEIKKLRAGVKG